MINKYSYCCNNMEMLISEDVVIYNEVFDEYCFPLCEDRVSVVILEYCPWCGKKLPKSKREEWFVQLEALGYENPLYCEDIPKAFKSGEWRRHST